MARAAGAAVSGLGAMAEDRTADMWALVVAHAASKAQPVSVADVCAVVVRSAQVSGGWVTAGSTPAAEFLVCVTDSLTEQLAELEMTLGEGPGRDAATAGAPALAGDLSDAGAGRRWPAFSPAARGLGVRAIFALPLMIGAIRTGVLGMYRDTAGPLTEIQLGDCLILADAATMLLLDSQQDGADTAALGAGMPELAGRPPDLTVHRTEIDQATGMLTEQLGVNVADAFARLAAYAYTHERRLAEVARDIVARRLRLPPDLSLDDQLDDN
jgi:hypothetical protein